MDFYVWLLSLISPWIFTGRTDDDAPMLGHLRQRADSLEKTLMLGKTEGRRRRGWQRIRLDGIIDSMDMCLRKLWETVKDREAWRAAVHEAAESDTKEQWNNNSIRMSFLFFFGHSFLFVSNIPLYGYITFILIHSSAGGYLGCFHFYY